MGIKDLSQGSLSTASQIPFYDPANGVDRRAPAGDLAAVLGIPTVETMITQYAAPNASGFSVLIDPPTDGASMFLLLTPAAGYAAGTITLPVKAECQDGQELLVSCTQAVTALTVAGNGATVNGAPTTLAANAFFRLRFDAVFGAWYRIG